MPKSLLLASIVLAGGCGSDDISLCDVHFGEDARAEIVSDPRNWIPEGASDFYFFHSGFAGNHTDYWSFTCENNDDCFAVAERFIDRADLITFEFPRRAILQKGPGYFDESFQTVNWDLRTITNGVMAEETRRNNFLDFVAIDLKEHRVLVTRWSGGFPANERGAR